MNGKLTIGKKKLSYLPYNLDLSIVLPNIVYIDVVIMLMWKVKVVFL